MMQKLIEFLTGTNKTPELQPYEDLLALESQNQPLPPKNKQNEETRPLYRIGTHSPVDIQRAIDMSG